MLKMIISCRRNPRLSRPEFFHHLRHVHWPLIQRHPEVMAALPAYVQNHGVVANGEFKPVAPYPVASERDSVIELWFDGIEGIDRLLSIPAYQHHVRPDEASFNDLTHNIMVLAEATTVFRAPSVGRCKRFDFIRRSTDIGAKEFAAEMKNQARELALDPFYTAHIDRHVENFTAIGGQDGGFGSGAFDCVREVWAASFAAIAATAQRSVVATADKEKSFSVLATEFPMRRTIEED